MRRFLAVVLLVMGITAPAWGGEAGTGTLVITVTGVTETRGEIVVSWFDSEEEFRKAPAGQRKVRVTKAGEVTVRCEGVSPGRCALTVHQDFNGDGKVNTNFVGIPKEPYAFGNNATVEGGPPSFAAACVEVRAGEVLTMKLNLLRGQGK